jgi:CDP-ribitol ribitolphosphotransferase
MKVILISILKFGLRVLYAPMKLFKTKNQIVYLSRQRNEKGIDIKLLEQAISEQDSSVNQVFRLKMIDNGIIAKIKYCFYVIGDMYYLATSKVAIVDTYSITVSCLNHKSDLKVIQMWHALGAIKKFGLQSVGTKEGRDEKISKAMCMHKNYDYVLAPSAETAKFYMEAFGTEQSKIKICAMPRVDFITDGNARTAEFYSQNPNMGDKKIVLYLPTFRDREPYVAQMLKTEFADKEDYQLIISTHPLSKVKKDEQFSQNGDFSSFDLMKIADIIITDYSACAFEASLLMKPLYFFVPDYNEYMRDRGINVDIREEMPNAVFDEADKLFESIESNNYDMDCLYRFKEKYIESSKDSNSAVLAKFILMLMGD